MKYFVQGLGPHPPAPFGPSWAQGSRPLLLGAKVGNSLSCFLQGLQQKVHAVLRVDANLLVGQVNVKLNSCRKRKWGVWGGSRDPPSQSQRVQAPEFLFTTTFPFPPCQGSANSSYKVPESRFTHWGPHGLSCIFFSVYCFYAPLKM